MIEHEYSVLGGVSRAKVGRYLSIIAASVSAGIVFLLFWAVDIAEKLGVHASIPPSVLALVGAGAVFSLLYWVLDKYAWRWGAITTLLKVPDLSGDWECEGQSINPDLSAGTSWLGTVTIIQSWDKLRIRLKTAQSGSNSITAAMMCDEADGYRVFYSYKNEPRIEETDLRAHRGFAEITFAKNLQSGEGEYFNGCGRFTFGTMKLKRF